MVVVIENINSLWCDCIISVQDSWSKTPTPGAPKIYTNKGSTTNYCLEDHSDLDILELSANVTLYHQQQKFIPSISRSIAMLKNKQLWLFACSWLEANPNTEVYYNFANLGSKSLGSILFQGQYWQRSEFMFSSNNLAFIRQSGFLGRQGELLILREFFLKNIYDAACYYAQTKSKTEHE